jgi:hypothetical protein
MDRPENKAVVQTIDITLDKPVLNYLEHGTFLDDLSQREVARVRRRARTSTP